MLLKKLLKPLCKQLLKINRVKSFVKESLKRLEDERKLEHKLHLMSSSYTIRKDVKPLNFDISDTTPTEKNEVIVDYSDTRMIGQRGVTPFVMRPFGMWRWMI